MPTASGQGADMRQSQVYSPDLQQQQTMTHQQIQSLEMLAAPAMELYPMIREEMEKNPLLDVESSEEPRELLEESSTEDPTGTEEDEWIEKLLELDGRFQSLPPAPRQATPDEDERRRHYFDSIAVERSLREDVEAQLSFLDLSADMRELCELIVSGVDDEGYHTSHPADLAMATGESMETVEKAIGIVQSLEPVGVAARDLRERFLIQLARKGMEDTLTYRVVAEHLDDIGNNRLPTLARKLHLHVDELEAVVQDVRQLTPFIVADEHTLPDYVQEEGVVEEKSGRLEVRMNASCLPHLRLSNHYRQLLGDPSTPPDVREYIRRKTQAAAHVIGSLAQRQTTLERIIQTIVDVQGEFFRYGREHMKPLTMGQVADRIGVHETTVSRGVAGKYVRCRHGLIPLKDFFTAGYEDETGKTVSNTVVKEKILALVKGEDPKAPLSDVRIADELERQGLKVARRTVTKYREAMKILPSNKRRRYW